MRTLLGVISTLLLTFSVSGGALPPTKKSDAELSERLVGSWEIKFVKRYPPYNREFISFDSRGDFKLIKITKFSDRQVRSEEEGKWRVLSGVLIREPKLIPEVGWSSPRVTHPIVSVQNEVVILRTDAGNEELRKVSIPPQLPPILSPAVFQASAIVKPRAEYPIDARRQRLEGKGIYDLTIDEKTGVVRAVEVRQSTGHKILDDAAVKALRNWRYKPHTAEAAAIPVNFHMPRP
jgi:TonB family protein